MKQLWSVMRFEFLSFAKSGTFIGMTILMVAVALLGPAIPAIISAFSGVAPTRTIAVYDSTRGFTQGDIAAFVNPQAMFVGSPEEARLAVMDGTANYGAYLRDGGFTLYVSTMGMGVANIEGQLRNLYRENFRVQAFYDLGLSHAEVSQILGFSADGEIMTVGGMADGAVVAEAATMDAYVQNFAYAYVLAFILYLSLMVGGTYLLTTVIREKSTKTMELLVTSCKPGKMLNGKVLGVGAAVLVKILLMVAAAIISMAVVTTLTDGGMLGELLFTVNLQPYLLALMAVFFILGFVMYSYIYAALASTVSRMEDANSIGTLPMMLVMVGFFASMIGMSTPGATWVVTLSHIPLFAPFVMFTRVVLGTAEYWEIAVSLVAMVATIALLSFLGSKIYRMGTLMYGNKPKLKDLFQAFRQ